MTTDSLPTGWRREPIRSFAIIGTGAKDTQDRAPSGMYPFFVRSQTMERINSWAFDGEAVLTAGDGVGTGKVFHYINGKFDYHQRVYRISNFRHDVSGKYFFYQFSQNFLARIESLTAKSSVDSVRMETIAGMEIALPRRAEQERIVHVIDDADQLVRHLERLITKKEAIKQGMMQQLLTGETRLPGFNGLWANRPIGAVAHVTMGQSPPSLSYNFDRSGLPLVQGNADIRGRRTIDRLWTSIPTKRCAAGDVLLTVRAPVGSAAIASSASCLGRGVCALRAHGNGRYLFHALVRAESRWATVGQGSTFTAVDSSQVLAFPIALPDDPAEQAAIAAVLDEVEISISLLRARLAKAKSIKQGMMQQLLTGRTRLPAAEEEENR
jgi:type I restriction enzyme, S subunit